MKRILLVFIIVSFLFLFTKTVTAGSLYKEYFLFPLNSSVLLLKPEVVYPYVKISPQDKNYPIIELLEKIDQKTKKYDELFFATKRISELEKWGNDLDWDKTLHKYDKHMNSYISSTVNTSNTTVELKQILLSHRSHLQKTLYSSEKSDEEKNAIKKVLDTIFDRLNTRLEKYVPQYDPFHLIYSLQDIVREKKYGKYDVIIEFPIEDSFHDMPQLNFGNTSYSGTVDNELGFLTFKNVVIKPGINFIDLSFKEKNIIKDPSFQENSSTKNLYTYSFETQNLDKGQYIVKLQNKFDNLIIFQLARTYQDQGFVNSDYVINETVYPQNNPITYMKFEVKEINHPILNTKFVITADRPISNDDASNFKVEVYPLYEPEISLLRTAYLPGFIPTSGYKQIEKNNSFFILWLLSLAAILFFVCVLFIRPFLFNTIKSIQKIPLSYRTLFSLAVLVGFMLDIFIISQKSSFILALLIILWTSVLIGNRLESRINFIFALIFLAFSPLLLIFKQTDMAEKSAIWAYIMLVTGAVHRAVEMKLKPQKLMDFSDFFRLFMNSQLIIVLSQVKKIVIVRMQKTTILLYNLIYKVLKFVFKKLPKTLKEYLIFTAKTIALIFLMVILIRSLVDFIIDTNNQINAENRKRYRLSLNPKIIDIQPKLAYHSTKVIIYGQYFGWKQNDKVRLVKDDEDVVTDLWTDSKIIFTVPLHWDSTYTNLWVEKLVPWEGNSIVVKSETVNIKVLQVRTPYTYEDDQFFEQLKNLNKEVLEINGYK